MIHSNLIQVEQAPSNTIMNRTDYTTSKWADDGLSSIDPVSKSSTGVGSLGLSFSNSSANFSA